MIKTYIIGERSYLSKNLKNNIKNSEIYSLNDLLKKKSFNEKKINIIYNHGYPLFKLAISINYQKIVEAHIHKIILFLKFFKKKNLKIKTLIFSSSSSVYGVNYNQKDFSVVDRNLNIYRASKLLAEQLLISYKKIFNYNLVIARIFNIYGENEKNSLISKIIESKKLNKKIIIYNNGNSYRDFIHVDDVVLIYKKILIKNNISGIFDIGTGKATKIKSLINKFFKKKDQINYKNKNFDETNYSKANTKRLFSNIEKISFVRLADFLLNKLTLDIHSVKKNEIKNFKSTKVVY